MDLGDAGPISFSQILDRMFAVYRRYFFLLIGVAGLPYLILAAIGLIFVVASGMLGTLATPAPAAARVPMAFYATMFLGLIILVWGIFLVGASLAWVATSAAVWDLQMGKRPTIRSTYRLALRRLGTIVVAGFLAILAMMAGFILLIIPGIIVWLSISLSGAILAAEETGPVETLKRSWRLTEGYRWKIFVTIFLCGIISMAFGYMFQIPALLLMAFVSNSGGPPAWAIAIYILAYLVGWVLPAPLLAIALSLIYYDSRVRKEGFDLQRMLDTLPSAAGAAAPQTPAVS
ncbi:MAG TPA: hypothetical protein VKR82_17205 [Candidatus Acidoferrales bacterium]|nr:hypothetical protein [Candidatus Acidoferrales bacterium]